jgi:hypothetical protein
MTKRTVQASGLKQGGGSARRAVSASALSAGALLQPLFMVIYGDANPEINPQISFESLKSNCHRHV